MAKIAKEKSLEELLKVLLNSDSDPVQRIESYFELLVDIGPLIRALDPPRATLAKAIGIKQHKLFRLMNEPQNWEKQELINAVVYLKKYYKTGKTKE